VTFYARIITAKACRPSTITLLLNCPSPNPRRGSRTKYRRFATAAEALRYAVEDLRIPKAFGAWLEVGDERFDSSEIQRLYEAGDYPLSKPERASAGAHEFATRLNGAPPAENPRKTTPAPYFQIIAKASTAPSDFGASC
jgi:hypothetical protein